MATPGFSIKETLQTAWHEVKGAKATFWAVFGLLFVLQVGMQLLDKQLHQQGALPTSTVLTAALLSLVLNILYMILTWSTMYLGICRARHTPIRLAMISDVFDLKIFFRMIGIGIIQSLVFLPAAFCGVLAISGQSFSPVAGIAAAILALIAFYIVIRLLFASAIVLAEGQSLSTALGKSWAATRSHVIQLFLLVIVNVLILLVSSIPFGIGLIWSLPFFCINYGVVYKRLIP